MCRLHRRLGVALGITWLTACATTAPLVYDPATGGASRELPTPEEARARITEIVTRIVRPSKNGGRANFDAGVLTVRIVDEDAPERVFERCVFRLASDSVPGVRDWGEGLMSAMRYQVDLVPGSDLCNLIWKSKEDAYGFVDALQAMKRSGSGLSRLKSEQARFTEIAARYRANPGKHRLPEHGTKQKVRAEDAFAKKEFDRAIELYEKLLEIAPWYPSARFNRALLLGELKRQGEAIEEMKRYLELEPDAKDAREAKNKIYIWEGEN